MLDLIYSKNINYLIKCAEKRNFSHAAKELYISQSTLSLAMKQLEVDLGYQVFVRKRGMSEVRLTDKAMKLLTVIQKYRDLLDNDLKKLESKSVPIKIATIPYFGRKFLLPVLAEKQILNKCNVFHVRSGTAISAANKMKVDLAFVAATTRPMRNNEFCVEIKKEDIGIVGLKPKFKHIEKASSVTELENEPWVVGDRPRDDWFDSLEGKNNCFYVDDHYSARFLVLGGYAIAPFQLDYFTEKELTKLSISRVKIPSEGLKVFALINKNTEESKRKLILSIIDDIKRQTRTKSKQSR